MPWMETSAMDERLRFIQDAQSDRWTMVALCERCGISCRIDYKWLPRYAEEGRRGLTGVGARTTARRGCAPYLRNSSASSAARIPRVGLLCYLCPRLCSALMPTYF